MIIDSFRKDYYFLSNFYNADVNYNGLTYRNNESAFQAQKDLSRREEFVNLSGAESRKLGKTVNLRKDWEKVKVHIMEEIVRAKFTQNEDLKWKLLDTEDAFLIEGNNWNDTFWGMSKGRGSNWLGRILMKVREELRNEIK